MTIRIAVPLTVYYDASCPLCRSEIETLKARDANDALRVVDCSSPAFDGRAEASEGVTRADMMARIHARDAAGRWLRGMDVFAAVYDAAGLRLLARIYASRILRPAFDRLYPWVADHRQLLSRAGLWRAFAWIAPRQAASCRACSSIDSAKMPPIENR